MKKYLFILLFICLANLSMAQRVKVVDTLRMELTGIPNDPTIHKMVMHYKKYGWRIISADKIVKDGQELYTWKLETYVIRKVRKK